MRPSSHAPCPRARSCPRIRRLGGVGSGVASPMANLEDMGGILVEEHRRRRLIEAEALEVLEAVLRRPRWRVGPEENLAASVTTEVVDEVSRISPNLVGR